MPDIYLLLNHMANVPKYLFPFVLRHTAAFRTHVTIVHISMIKSYPFFFTLSSLVESQVQSLSSLMLKAFF